MTSSFQIHSTVPVVSTDDVAKSIAYYITILGFSPDFQFGNPVMYAGVKSGEAEIYFAHDPATFNLNREKISNLKSLYGCLMPMIRLNNTWLTVLKS